MKTILSIKNISKSYINKIALQDVTFDIPEGCIFGLLGPNGAGKTTLIRIINQILIPDKGEIFFYDKKLSLNDLIYFGYLPEERGLYKKMKVCDQVIFFAQLKGLSKNEATEKALLLFERLNMKQLWNKKIEELSKGMQQKIQFIISIINNPKVLILDEPFTGLDPINIMLFKNEIKELQKNGTTILISTHIMPSVEELCDRIVLLNNSRIVLEGEVYYLKKKFKKNLYEIEFEPPVNNILIAHNINYQIIETFVTSYGTIIYKLKVNNENYSTKDLLQDLIKTGKIIKFNEILPTMEEIFVNVVKNQ